MNYSVIKLLSCDICGSNGSLVEDLSSWQLTNAYKQMLHKFDRELWAQTVIVILYGLHYSKYPFNAAF